MSNDVKLQNNNDVFNSKVSEPPPRITLEKVPDGYEGDTIDEIYHEEAERLYGERVTINN